MEGEICRMCGGDGRVGNAVTAEGAMLAREVDASAALSRDAKARLVAEIVNDESTHGRCTKTFVKKLRKQTRPAAE
jgi:hypothetical protein